MWAWLYAWRSVDVNFLAGNIALGRTVYTSLELPAVAGSGVAFVYGSARNIVDGRKDTFISAYLNETSNVWISIDLGDLMEINHIVLWLYPSEASPPREFRQRELLQEQQRAPVLPLMSNSTAPEQQSNSTASDAAPVDRKLVGIEIRVGNRSINNLLDTQAIAANVLVWRSPTDGVTTQQGRLDAVLEPSVRGQWVTLQAENLTGKVSLLGGRIPLRCTPGTMLVVLERLSAYLIFSCTGTCIGSGIC